MDDNNILTVTHPLPDPHTSSVDDVIIELLMTSQANPRPPAFQLTASIKALMMLYNIMMLLIGVLGNMGVLYLSLRHRALKMDAITLVFIENLALADIMISLLFYVPMLITIPTEKWLFGNALCWFSGFFSSHVPFIAEIIIIATISCYRLWVLKKPPGARRIISMTYVKALISLIWFSCFVPVIYWISAGCHTFFFKGSFICWSSNHLPESPAFLSTTIFTGFYIALPMAVIFLTNVKILCTMLTHTLRAGKSLLANTRPCLAISLICWAMLLSYLPLFILIVLKTTETQIPRWYPVFQTYAKGLHVFVNPVVYVATNRRFRRHVVSLVRVRVRRRSYLAIQTNVTKCNNNS